MSTIAQLRAATWASHQKLEKRLDVKTRFSNTDAYAGHLQKMWGFCVAIEEQMEPLLDEALDDYELRLKAPLLTRDLLALGVDLCSVARLPRCQTVPRCQDTAAAFGCVYVLEGATLGGRTLLPLVQTRLGLTAERGASFLASYGEDVPTMWRTFGTALDVWCSAEDRGAHAAATAVATFDSLAVWLCGES